MSFIYILNLFTILIFLPDSKTEGLCQQLLIAFLNGMSDTEGKVAMSKLLERIICETKMAMSVVCTGAAHRSRFASKVMSDVTVCQSSSGSEDNVPPPKKGPGSAHQAKSPRPIRPKYSTPDVLVFKNPLEIYMPIDTKLLISVKKGFKPWRGVDICRELLSRLPYIKEDAKCFGLEISANQANLYSVHLSSAEPVRNVYLLEYKTYQFELSGTKHFSIESFITMVQDIVFILKQ